MGKKRSYRCFPLSDLDPDIRGLVGGGRCFFSKIGCCTVSKLLTTILALFASIKVQIESGNCLEDLLPPLSMCTLREVTKVSIVGSSSLRYLFPYTQCIILCGKRTYRGFPLSTSSFMEVTRVLWVIVYSLCSILCENRSYRGFPLPIRPLTSVERSNVTARSSPLKMLCGKDRRFQPVLSWKSQELIVWVAAYTEYCLVCVWGGGGLIEDFNY